MSVKKSTGLLAYLKALYVSIDYRLNKRND